VRGSLCTAALSSHSPARLGNLLPPSRLAFHHHLPRNPSCLTRHPRRPHASPSPSSLRPVISPFYSPASSRASPLILTICSPRPLRPTPRLHQRALRVSSRASPFIFAACAPYHLRHLRASPSPPPSRLVISAPSTPAAVTRRARATKPGLRQPAAPTTPPAQACGPCPVSASHALAGGLRSDSEPGRTCRTARPGVRQSSLRLISRPRGVVVWWLLFAPSDGR